jgi:hypothetical protein
MGWRGGEGELEQEREQKNFNRRLNLYDSASISNGSTFRVFIFALYIFHVVIFSSFNY